MKKLILPIAVAIMAFSLVSCGSKKTATDDVAGGGVAKVASTENAETEESVPEDDTIEIEAETGALDDSLTNSGITSTGDLAVVAAIQSGEKDACLKLGKEAQQGCYDQINYDDAIFKNDYAKCELIKASRLKARCIAKVSDSISKNATSATDCAKIKNSAMRSSCETRVKAVSSPKDSKSCETLANVADKLQCFDQLILAGVRSGKTTDASVCQRVVNPVLKKECEAWIKRYAAKASETATQVSNATAAAKTSAVSSCEGREGADKQYCLMEAAVETAKTTGSASGCAAITDQTVKTACQANVQNTIARAVFDEAAAKKDPSLCNRISDASLQSRCKEIVSQ